jgi:hypothetical protein
VKDTPDRRRDDDLRKSIDEYRVLAAETAESGLRAKDDATKERYLELAMSLTKLADMLQGRPSENPIHNA